MRASWRARGRMGASVVVAAVVWAFAACSDSTGPQFEVIETATFHDSLGIVLADFTKLSSGVYIRDDSIGTGPVIAAGDSASIDHTAWLANGAQLSTGVFPIEYADSVNPLIEGFTIGLEGMAEGGTRFFIVPPELAYGANPRPPIPVGAILIFEVDLLDVY